MTEMLSEKSVTRCPALGWTTVECDGFEPQLLRADEGATGDDQRVPSSTVTIHLDASGATMAVQIDGQIRVVGDGSPVMAMVVARVLGNGQHLMGSEALLAIQSGSAVRVSPVGRDFWSSLVPSSLQCAVPASAFDVSGPGELTASETLTMLLGDVRARARASLGHDDIQLILVVPTHLDLLKRSAIREAAATAGPRVCRIYGVSTASVLTHPCVGPERVVLACHLGATHAEAAVVEISDRLCDVRSVVGDACVGSDDYTERVVRWSIKEFQRRTGHRIEKTPAAREVLWGRAEAARCELVSKREAHIDTDSLAGVSRAAPRLSLSRHAYQELTLALSRRIIACALQALDAAEVPVSAVDRILPSGRVLAETALVKELRQAVAGRWCQHADPVVAPVLGPARQWRMPKEFPAILETNALQWGVRLAGGQVHLLESEGNQDCFTSRLELVTPMPDSRVLTLLLLQADRHAGVPSVPIIELRISNLKADKWGFACLDVIVDVGWQQVARMVARDMNGETIASGSSTTALMTH